MIRNGLDTRGLSITAKDRPEMIHPAMMVRFRPTLSPIQPWNT